MENRKEEGTYFQSYFTIRFKNKESIQRTQKLSFLFNSNLNSWTPCTFRSNNRQVRLSRRGIPFRSRGSKLSLLLERRWIWIPVPGCVEGEEGKAGRNLGEGRAEAVVGPTLGANCPSKCSALIFGFLSSLCGFLSWSSKSSSYLLEIDSFQKRSFFRIDFDRSILSTELFFSIKNLIIIRLSNDSIFIVAINLFLKNSIPPSKLKLKLKFD